MLNVEVITGTTLAVNLGKSELIYPCSDTGSDNNTDNATANGCMA